MKENLKKLNLKNPIVRNVVVIIGIILMMVALGVVASIINALLGFLVSLGWKIIITIAVTAVLCGAIFGYAEIKSHGYKVVKKDDNEEDERDNEFGI